MIHFSLHRVEKCSSIHEAGYSLLFAVMQEKTKIDRCGTWNNLGVVEVGEPRPGSALYYFLPLSHFPSDSDTVADIEMIIFVSLERRLIRSVFIGLTAVINHTRPSAPKQSKQNRRFWWGVSKTRDRGRDLFLIYFF